MPSQQPENLPASSDALERERSAVLATYATWVTTATTFVYFEGDLRSEVNYVNRHDQYDDGQDVTDAERRALAASTILAQIAECRINEEPVVVSPLVKGCLDVYQDAQTAIDAVDLRFTDGVMEENATVRTTAMRLEGKDAPTTDTIEVAVAVLNARGTITMEMESIDDIVAAGEVEYDEDAAPDAYYEQKTTRGTQRVELRDLSNLEIQSTPTELHYYRQFYEVEHGTKWLASLLEDLQAIRARW